MSLRTASLLLALCVGVALPARSVSAQQAPEGACASDPATCGKKEFDKGVAAYQKGDFSSAVQHFKQALAYRAHPVVAFNLALAEGKSGALVEAVARLDQIATDPQASDKLKANAARERDSFAAGIGAVVLESAVAEGVEASVDGTALTGSPPAIQVNPGRHHVLIRVDGRTVVDRDISVNPGERVRLAITREREVSVVLPPTGGQPVKNPVPQTPKPEPTGIDPLWFYGAAGLTVVCGGLATWSGLDTKAAYDDYKAALPTASQQEVDRRVSEGHDKETRTNVLLGATALAAVGTAALGLFAVSWGSSSGETTRVAATPGGVTVFGRF